MVSIIIPTYNNSYALQHYSLPGLLKQTFLDWEALIINDGSTDDSSKIIHKFSATDTRFKVIEQTSNRGLAAALNLGVKSARGDIIAILEHDDIWLPEKLALQIKSLQNGAQISTCDAVIYNTKKKKFIKINGGNFSCLVFTKSSAPFLFPLPEEDKKYLGIEDGLIAAELAIAQATGKIKTHEISHINRIMTIMNSNASTLSGLKDSRVMMKRYQNAFDLYSPLSGQYPDIDILLKFWKKHYNYNRTIARLPRMIKVIVYYLTEKIKNLKNGRRLALWKKQQEYLEIKKYREMFN